MDMQTIVTLIGTLGFPIVMCLLMFNRMDKDSERMDMQTKETTDAINKLERAIVVLTERLTGGHQE